MIGSFLAAFVVGTTALAPASVVDFGVGSRGEVGAGYVPVNSQAPAEPAVQVLVDLRGGFRLMSKVERLVLRTGPRVFGLFPNTAGIDRPLVFYTLDANYAVQHGRRVTTIATASGGVGELSYAMLSQVFVPGTGALASSVIPLATGTAQWATTWQNTRRNALTLLLGLNGQTSLNDTASGSAILPSFASWSAGVNEAYHVSFTDTVGLTTSFEWLLGGANGNFYAVHDFFKWSRRLDTSSTLALSGGLDVVVSTLGETRWIGNGSVEHAASGGSHGRRFTLRDSAGVRSFFDRINFTYRPQAFVQLAGDLDWTPKWRSSVALFASTNIGPQPIAPGFFETFVGLDIPNRHRLSDDLDLVFGMRNLLRGPHLSTFDIDTVQGQFLVFAGFDWSSGTNTSKDDFMR